MSDLSRSLIDAAAEALRTARFVDPDDDTMPTFHQPGDAKGISDGRIDVWKPPAVAAEAAVVAVLETLSAETGPLGWWLTHLAAEVRGTSRVQCSGAVHSLSLSAPERCALDEGHEGECAP